MNKKQQQVLSMIKSLVGVININDIYNLCLTLGYVCHNKDADMLNLMFDIVAGLVDRAEVMVTLDN